MELASRQRIFVIGAIVGAIVAGWHIAYGNVGFVAIAALGAFLLATHHWLRVTPDVLAGSAVLFGYLVANRGFAQIHLPGIPLFPGEITLVVGFACGLWRWARAKQMPVRHDAVNILLLVWIVATATRLPIDFKQYGLMALRDFAIVYYAGFFFLGQMWGEQGNSHRWIVGAMTLGLAFTVPAFVAFLRWPEITSKLAVFGVPVIFVKSDVAGGFMAAGVIWFGARFAQSRRWGWVALAVLSLVGVAVCNSRAAMVALGVGMIWLCFLRAWTILRTIAGLAAIGLVGLAVQAAVTDKSIATTPIYRLYESALSIADVQSARTYQVADLGDKPDNNQFRLVWWRLVFLETWNNRPWTGLGFGHDLAAQFSRVYFGDASEDFSARSPHNFLLTVYVRTGFLGLTLLLALLVAVAAKTWRTARHAIPGNAASLPLWLACWCVLASACFGVVLEGPMGAAVFWTTLGLANATAGLPASPPVVEEEAQTPVDATRFDENSVLPA